MASKMKKKEIEEFIKSKSTTQDTYIAPTVRTHVDTKVPAMAQVAQTVKPTIGQTAGYIGKAAKTGLVGGVTSVPTSNLQEIEGGLKKGKNIKNVGDVAKQIVNSLSTISNITNPLSMQNVLNTASNMSKSTKKALKDKNKDTLSKALSIGTAAVSNAADMSNPTHQLAESVFPLVGAVDKKSDQKVRNLIDTINKPNEKLQQELAEESQNHGKVANMVASGVQAATNMIPSLAATAITKNPNIGMAVMANNVKGQATEEALKQGKSLEEAREIGNVRAAAEVATEMLSGGLANIYGKGATDDVAKNIIDRYIQNPTANFLATKASGIVGENVEESLSNVLNKAIDKGTVDPNAKVTMNDITEPWGPTTISTLLLNGATGDYGRASFNQNAAQLQAQSPITKVQNMNDVERNALTEITMKRKQGIPLDENDMATINYLNNRDNVATDQNTRQVQNVDNNVINNMVDAQRGQNFEDNLQLQPQETNTLQNDIIQQKQNIQNELQQIQQEQSNQVNIENLQNSAIQNGINIDDPRAQSIQTFMERRGIDCSFDKNYFTDNNVNALWLKDENGNRKAIFNPKASEESIIEEIAVHEMAHDIISSKNSKNALKFDKVLNYAKTLEGYEQARQDIENTYAKHYDINNPNFESLIDEEVVADFLGKKLGNQEFVNQMVDSNPSLARKFYNWILDKYDSIVNSNGKNIRNEELYFRNLKNNFEKAYNKSYKNNGKADTRFAIKRNDIIEDYTKIYNESNVKQDNEGRTLSKQQQERYKDVSDKLKDENGNIKVFHHGTKRADRVGNVFDPARATSGPMAFFTDNAEVAKGYSESKQDTSISREYDTEYDLFKANNKSLDDYWNSLSKTQQDKINEAGRNIGLDEDFENAIYGENASKNSFGDQYDYYLRDTKNNGLKALYKLFIEDGNFLFDDMYKFQNVLELAGVKDVEYLDPYKVDSKVYDVYLNIKNPFDTSEISNEMVAKLREASKTAKTEETYSADMWDKSNRSPESWMEALDDDLKEGTTHAWTSIPDWVTDVLKENGYDGIVDTGGKGGGQAHQVAIPFYSNQIKNIDNLKPTDNNDIRKSVGSKVWDEFLDKNVKSEGTKTRLKDIKMPLAEVGKEKGTRNSSFNNNQNAMKDNSSYLTIDSEGNSKMSNEVPKVLDKSPTRESDIHLSDVLDASMQRLVNKGHNVDKVAKQTGNNRIRTSYDRVLAVGQEGQNQIGKSQTNLLGKEYKNFKVKNKDGKIENKSLSVNGIYEDAEASGVPSNVLDEYAVNKLNLDRRASNNENWIEQFPNMTEEYSQNVIDDIERLYPEIKRVHGNLTQYYKNLRNNMEYSGILSKESQEYYDMNTPNYVRIQRVGGRNGSASSTQSRGGVKVNNQQQKIKGGNMDILPIRDTTAQFTLDTLSSMRKNIVAKELAKVIAPESSLENTMIEFGDNKQFNGETAIKNKNGEYQLTYFENGEAKTIPIDSGIYYAMTNPEISKGTKLIEQMNQKYGAGLISRAQRGLLTDKNAYFILTNFFKDIGDAPLNSKYTKSFVKNYPSMWIDLANGGPYSSLWKNSGGEASSYFKDGRFVGESTATNIVGKTIEKVGKGVEKALTPIEIGNNFIEQLPRLTEFKSTIEANGYEVTADGDIVPQKGKNPTKSVDEVLDEAMYNSAEITTNFKRGGTWTKAANRNGATFLNASVQGFDKFIRNFTDVIDTTTGKPKINSKAAVKLMLKATLFGIAPSMINDIMNGDDDDYEDIPEYQKDSYYLFKLDNHKWLRIPKGRMTSIFGSAARRTKNLAKGDTKAFDGFIQQTQNQVAPNNPFTDNAFAGIFAVKNNKSWSGNPIVSTWEENPEHPEDEYDSKTDEFSKWLGKKLHKSPKKINYVLDQYSGIIGDILLPLNTKYTNTPMDNKAAQSFLAPLQSKFTTNDIMSNKSQSEFYDAYTKAQNEVSHNKKNNIEKPEDNAVKSYLTNRNKEMSEIKSKIEMVQASNMTNKEKIAKVQEYQDQINTIAKDALKDVVDAKENEYYMQIGDYYYKRVVRDGKDTYERDTSKNIPTEKYALYDYYKEKYEKSKR